MDWGVGDNIKGEGFEDLTAVSTTMAVFWDVASCSLLTFKETLGRLRPEVSASSEFLTLWSRSFSKQYVTLHYYKDQLVNAV
jgi:hypothetical protein